MTEREIYKYRSRVNQLIAELGMNPDEELPIVTIKEMREWLDERDEMMRDIAREEEGENYDPKFYEGTIYTDLQEDPETGLLTTDYFKHYEAEFVYVHMLAEQCFEDPARVDWKTVTCGYNHRIINTLRSCYSSPLVWTGVTPDLETRYIITGDVAQEVEMPTRLHDDKMVLQDKLTFEGALLWFADELPKGNNPLVWRFDEPVPAPENMVIWTYITANYAALPSDELPEEERDYSRAYFDPYTLRWNMDFIAKHRGGKRAAQIVRLLRDDWFEIKAQKMFGMNRISNEQIEQFEFALFAGMDRSLRIWDAEIEDAGLNEGKSDINKKKPDGAFFAVGEKMSFEACEKELIGAINGAKNKAAACREILRLEVCGFFVLSDKTDQEKADAINPWVAFTNKKYRFTGDDFRKARNG